MYMLKPWCSAVVFAISFSFASGAAILTAVFEQLSVPLI